MKKTLLTLLIILISMGVGYMVYKYLGSEKAGYIVAVVGTAAGLAGLYISLSENSNSKVKSRITVGTATNSNITGVDYSGPASNQDSEASIQVKKIEQGDVTGVRRKETKR